MQKWVKLSEACVDGKGIPLATIYFWFLCGVMPATFASVFVLLSRQVSLVECTTLVVGDSSSWDGYLTVVPFLNMPTQILFYLLGEFAKPKLGAIVCLVFLETFFFCFFRKG